SNNCTIFNKSLGIERGGWWLVDYSRENVYKYDSSWNYTGTSYDLSNLGHDMHGIFQDKAGNWWITGMNTQSVYKFDSSWNYTGENHMGRRLGLQKSENSPDWSKKEIDFLKDNYLDLPYKKIGKKLNRTECAIRCKASKIGLKKPYDKRILRPDKDFDRTEKVTLA
ncbi:hypothetical protein AKJ52_01365, partial [candidate division MSBL1 archaeon SCGC-AAA382C18]